jgi:hypothetical protein
VPDDAPDDVREPGSAPDVEPEQPITTAPPTPEEPTASPTPTEPEPGLTPESVLMTTPCFDVPSAPKSQPALVFATWSFGCLPSGSLGLGPLPVFPAFTEAGTDIEVVAAAEQPRTTNAPARTTLSPGHQAKRPVQRQPVHRSPVHRPPVHRPPITRKPVTARPSTWATPSPIARPDRGHTGPHTGRRSAHHHSHHHAHHRAGPIGEDRQRP